jgi:hypothetical protein
LAIAREKNVRDAISSDVPGNLISLETVLAGPEPTGMKRGSLRGPPLKNFPHHEFVWKQNSL